MSILDGVEDRLGGNLAAAMETLVAEAINGFATEVPLGGVRDEWPAQTGLDLATLTQFRDMIEQVVLPAMEAGIAGRPHVVDMTFTEDGAFNERVFVIPTS